MPEANPYIGKSPAELERQFELLQQAMAAEAATQDVVAAAALKWGYLHLKKGGKLPTAFETVANTALPREAVLARPAGLSESQIDAIKKAVEDALGKVKLG